MKIINEPPEYLDGARVLYWTPIDARHNRTGQTRHYADGELQTDFKGLAIAAYEASTGIPKQEVYLFYCDETWEVQNDTYHNSIEAAKEQAEFEYTGTKSTWIEKRIKIDDLQNLPDVMTRDEVRKLCDLILKEADAEDSHTTLQKLEELGDRQWHMYELPDPQTQQEIRNWMIRNWISPTEAWLEGVLAVIYMFALDKQLFQRALQSYTGPHKDEFEKDLLHSPGEYIDPWWSMK